MSTWRIGKQIPINVYEDDRPVCQCHTAVDARRIAVAMNRVRGIAPVGRGSVNDDNDTDPAGRWAGPVGRGMMTAEQFLAQHGLADLSLYWPIGKPVPKLDYATGEAAPTLTQLLDAHAADQLAELRKASAIAEKYEQKLLRELGRVMTALRCTDEFDGPDEAVRTANELVQALEDADKIRAELGFADTAPLNVWLADLRAQLAEKEREIERAKLAYGKLFTENCENLGKIDVLTERLQEAQATNRELNRRSQAIQKSLNAESGRNSWHGYFTAALQLFAKRDDECADLRERLRQREAELEQRWIVVRERLPEHNVTILASDRQGRFSVGHLKPGGAWNFAKAISTVTHWQPLPSPPKVQP